MTAVVPMEPQRQFFFHVIHSSSFSLLVNFLYEYLPLHRCSYSTTFEFGLKHVRTTELNRAPTHKKYYQNIEFVSYKSFVHTILPHHPTNKVVNFRIPPAAGTR